MRLSLSQKRESEKANKSFFICGQSSFLLLLGWRLATIVDESCHLNFREMSCAKNDCSKYTTDVAEHNADTETLTAFGHFVRTIEFVLSLCVRCVDEPHSHVATELCRWTHYSYYYCPLKSYLLHAWFFICKSESEGWYENGINCQSNFYANGSRPSQASMCCPAHCTYTCGERNSRLIQHIIRYANLCWMHNAITYA